MLTEITRNEHLAHPFNDALASLEALKRKLENQLKDVNQIIANIVKVQSGVDGSSLPDLPAVIPGQYVGQRAVDALENYLRGRKGLRIPLDRAVQDLIAGGADTGQPGGRSADPAERMTHNLKIAIPNRTETFGWEPVVTTQQGTAGNAAGECEYYSLVSRRSRSGEEEKALGGLVQKAMKFPEPVTLSAMNSIPSYWTLTWVYSAACAFDRTFVPD